MNTAKLAQLYPILLVKNRQPHSIQINYSNGDSVQLPPHAQGRISSAGMSQLPPAQEVEFISPSLEELHNSGVIVLGKAVPTVDVSVPAEAPVAETTEAAPALKKSRR